MVKVKFLDQEIDRLERKKNENQSLGEVYKGIALGLNKYMNPLTRTKVHQNLTLTYHEAFDFLRRTVKHLNPESDTSLENKTNIPIGNFNNMYTKHLLPDLKERLIFGKHEEYINQKILSLENLLEDSKNTSSATKPIQGGLTIYDDVNLYASLIRYKDNDKANKKIAINLTIAYCLDNNIKLDLHEILLDGVRKYGSNPGPQAFLKKSEVDDRIGVRFITMNEKATQLLLNYLTGTISSENLCLGIKEKVKNLNRRKQNKKKIITLKEYLRDQAENKFKDFEVSKENGYRAHHVRIINPQYSMSFEGQYVSLCTHIRNEANPSSFHVEYDLISEEIEDRIPKKARSFYNDCLNNLRNFEAIEYYSQELPKAHFNI